jgi:hypothetical protein
MSPQGTTPFRSYAPWGLALLLLLCSGCPTLEPGASSDGGVKSPLDQTSIPFLDVDGNATFAQASKVAFQSSDSTVFEGEITGNGDVDVFDIGAFNPGDRLVIDVRAISGNLDPVAALFDSRQYVQAFNDDRTEDASNVNPLLDVILRGPAGVYYLGLANYPGSNSAGRYRVSVQVTYDVGVPEPQPQVVYLDWRGGQNIVIPNVGTYNLPPFDAADVGSQFAGQTEAIKTRVMAMVRQRYEGFGLTVLSSDNGPPPSGPHSTLYFGASSDRAFAISEKIDTQNSDPNDDAIVYTRSFRSAFSTAATLDSISTALANTAAHEIGHLLGLVHTQDCTELMDTSCGNDALLFQQSFGVAPLHRSVFPIGFQNALELIAWAIGVVGV